MQVCVVAAWLILTLSYQDKQSSGTTYYAFLFFGLASMAYVHVLFFVPFLWLMMVTNIQSLSWRTWIASLLGLLTPYWFWSSWLIYKNDITQLTSHFDPLTTFQAPFQYADISLGEIAVLALLVICTITGIVHQIRKSYADKIRIRLIFGFFIWTDLLAMLFLILQPQHSDMLFRFIIISTAPLIGHFLALTSTRITNAAFCVLTFITLFITAYQLWITSYLF